MTQEKLATLLAKLEAHPHPSIELKLERMRHFLQMIGNPEHKIPPIIHVAGTNGKGSTIAFIHAMIIASGKAAHRYTSPHLVDFNERFIIANKQIEDDALIEALDVLIEQQRTCPLTYFESATALAFSLFAKHPANATLLEVGLGGRLDASNVIESPLATVITPIAMDHQAFLGDSLGAIAAEKAAIMKDNVPCIVGKQKAEALEVIEKTAIANHAPLWRYGKEWEYRKTVSGGIHYQSSAMEVITDVPSLIGEHQYDNAALAIAVMDRVGQAIGVSKQGICEGVASAIWAGRLQYVPQANEQWHTHHDVYVDGGHNIHAATALAQWMKTHEKPVHIICGMRDDKDAQEVLSLLSSQAASLCAVTIPDEPSAISAETLCAYVSHMQKAESFQEAITNLTMTIPQKHSILITGSLYLVGAVLRELNDE